MTLALALALLTGASEPDLLAPAERGEMQCYTPDVARKTCRALASYVKQADGSYLNTARILLDPARDIVLETTTVVHVSSDGVCGRLTRSDALGGALTIAGVPQSPEQAAPVLTFFADIEEKAGFFGALICTRYPADGEMMKALVSVGGVRRPEFDDSVIWVLPDQGYRVGR